MLKKFTILSALLCASTMLRAQVADTLSNGEGDAPTFDENAFTFTEAQLDEDENDSRSATVLSSASNVFFSNASMTFSPGNYRFRALDNKYNEVYINGIMMNDPERGNFRFSQIGGLNNISRNSDYALPFEGNSYSYSGVAGSVNYDFRPLSVPQGHKLTATLANRTYTGRLMYTYGTGLQDDGWAFAVSVTGRYAAIKGFKNVEGAFYNSFSYYVGAQYVANSQNTIAVCTFANPTERGSRGASTDEAYYLAGSNSYNPYLGWYNGEMRNSRVVWDFAPTTIVTWDYTPNDKWKISTSAFFVISNYSTTKLSYNGVSNPSPDYYKNMPSYFYNVWNPEDKDNRDAQDLANWNSAYDYWNASVNNHYINFDALYYANIENSKSGNDALYFMPQIHTDRISVGASSSARYNINNESTLNFGISFSRHKSNHYQTMYDLLGAEFFHNINTYATGTYPHDAIQIQYDYRYPDAQVVEGDIFGYDYNIFVDKINAWAAYTLDKGMMHYYLTAKVGYTDMFREGKMQNGLAPNNSYGISDKSYFTDGGGKTGVTLNLGKGHVMEFGFGYEAQTPKAGSAFASPEINNDFVKNLVCEKILSAQLSYAYSSAMLNANLTAYYNRINDATKWTCFYNDDEHSFSYVSMSDMEKEYYGVELGMRVKARSNLEFVLLGTMSDAKYLNDCEAIYMVSNSAQYNKDIVLSKGMKEDGTPLAIGSLGVEYNTKGWYLELTGNYYDRIYLSFSPVTRYKGILEKNNKQCEPQAKGEGGFMLDGSVGKNIRLKHGSLYCGLMVTNILNNTNICTGGYEQSRLSYSYNESKNETTDKAYVFSQNPKKYYAWGINGMLNIVYRF